MTRSWVEVDQASIRPLESGFLKAWRRLREKEGKVLPHVSFVGSTWSDRSVFAEPDVHLAAAEKKRLALLDGLNRLVVEATVRRYRYVTRWQLREHVVYS